jgi:hypothetical protein
MRASTAYVQNWQLAGDAVDYLAAANAPSPVQHFWSLSIEEQFYLVWPVLIAVALGVTRGRPAQARRRLVALVLAVATGLSLVYSIAHTAADPAAAYFDPPTRAWARRRRAAGPGRADESIAGRGAPPSSLGRAGHRGGGARQPARRPSRATPPCCPCSARSR